MGNWKIVNCLQGKHLSQRIRKGINILSRDTETESGIFRDIKTSTIPVVIIVLKLENRDFTTTIVLQAASEMISIFFVGGGEGGIKYESH